MDAVVPEKAAEQFPQVPAFSPASFKNGIGQKIRSFFQGFKSPDPGFQNGAVVVCIHIDFPEIVGIDVFGMGVHFTGGAGNLSVKGGTDGCGAFVRIGNGFIKGKKLSFLTSCWVRFGLRPLIAFGNIRRNLPIAYLGFTFRGRRPHPQETKFLDF